MPREYVNGEPLASGQHNARISVGWSRADAGGHVQVATVAEATTSAAGYDGQFIDLDRTAINDLIRLLRKARDQAFGRDE